MLLGRSLGRPLVSGLLLHPTSLHAGRQALRSAWSSTPACQLPSGRSFRHTHGCAHRPYSPHQRSMHHTPLPDGPSGMATTASASSTTPFASACNISVSGQLDSGNIEVLDCPNAERGHLQLRIRPDPWCETDKQAHFQWFNFQVAGARGTSLTMALMNAGKASYPSAWRGSQAVASYDLQHWFRVPTSYDDASGVLTISHMPEHDLVRYAYFAPYTLEQHSRLIHRMQARPGVRLEILGQTVEKRDMMLLTVGEPGPEKRAIWVIARQHPGETQAEYFVEGLLERLTRAEGGDDGARQLRERAVFHVVPNMNLDGSVRGHLRTNAAGMNLNRAWAAPSADTTPEVLLVLRRMQQTGVDFLVDVHGDEELPHCFAAGNDGIPGWSERLKALQNDFCDAFQRANPAFQRKHGYPTAAPGTANLSLCSKQIGHQFNCLALTLELPFKDSLDAPDPVKGWSPESSAQLGADMLTAVLEMLPRLR